VQLAFSRSFQSLHANLQKESKPYYLMILSSLENRSGLEEDGAFLDISFENKIDEIIIEAEFAALDGQLERAVSMYAESEEMTSRGGFRTSKPFPVSDRV
jgi:hypothetical protein